MGAEQTGGVDGPGQLRPSSIVAETATVVRDCTHHTSQLTHRRTWASSFRGLNRDRTLLMPPPSSSATLPLSGTQPARRWHKLFISSCGA